MMPAVAVRKSEGQLLPPMFAFSDNNVRLIVHVQSNLYSGKDVLVRPVFGESIFVGDIRFFTSRQGNRGSAGNDSEKKSAIGKIISHFAAMTFACVEK